MVSGFLSPDSVKVAFALGAHRQYGDGGVAFDFEQCDEARRSERDDELAKAGPG
jgi:hypothetical protein